MRELGRDGCQELGARNWGPGKLNGGPWEGWGYQYESL